MPHFIALCFGPNGNSAAANLSTGISPFTIRPTIMPATRALFIRKRARSVYLIVHAEGARHSNAVGAVRETI